MERRYILRDDQRKQNCTAYIGTLRPDAKHPMQVLIAPFKKKRSVEQNARYWLILTIIAQEAFRLGLSCDPESGEIKFYEPEIWHEWAKRKFLGKRVIIDGDLLLLPESSAQQSVMDFAQYMIELEVWAAENGIVIPAEDWAA